MSADNFGDIVRNQREMIGEKRGQIENQIAELQTQLAEFDIELQALAAYEETKSGRSKPVAQGKTTVPRGTRGPRGKKQAEILELISKSQDGMTRDDVLQETGSKGDKSAEQSVSNILHTLKKAGKVVLEGKRYSVPLSAI